MTLDVRLRAEARVELESAAEWYADEREGLGDEFLGAIERCLDRIGATPYAAIVWRGDIRRRRVDRFPYQIFYRVTATHVDVIAIAHERRRPGYFAKER